MDNLNQTRIWLQENGELAFLAGMLLCFLLVTFIKFFSGLIALTVLTAITVYQIALPESEMDSRDSASGENGSVHEHSESSSDKESEDSSLTH